MPSNVCRVCKQAFETGRALRVHESRKHKIAGARWLMKRRPVASQRGKHAKADNLKGECNYPHADMALLFLH